jgi:hypothetical protein
MDGGFKHQQIGLKIITRYKPYEVQNCKKGIKCPRKPLVLLLVFEEK